MRRSFLVIVFFIWLMAPTAAIACSCVQDRLSKRFRKAEAIFVGRLADYDDAETSGIQSYKKGLWVFDVKRAFKGVSRERIAIDIDMSYSASLGSCPILYRFEDDVDYLVFAYGKDLKVTAVCSDSRPLRPEYDWTTKEINRLDNFWFRAKSRLWPF